MGEEGATLERFVTWAALRLDDVRPREVRRVAMEIEAICAGGPPNERDIAALVKMRRDALAGGHAILTAERVAREYQTWHKEGKPRAVASLRPAPREEPGSELQLEERGILSAASELIRSSSPPPSLPPSSRPISSQPPASHPVPSVPPSAPSWSRPPSRRPPPSASSPPSAPPSSQRASSRPVSSWPPPSSRPPPSATDASDRFESSDLLHTDPPPPASSGRDALHLDSEPPAIAAQPLRPPPPPRRKPSGSDRPISDRPPNSAARSGRAEAPPSSEEDDAYALAVDPAPSGAAGKHTGKDFDRDLASGKEAIVAPSSVPPPLMGKPPSLPPVRSVPAPVISEPVGPELFGVRLPPPQTMVRIALALIGVCFLAVYFLRPQWLIFGKGTKVSGTVTNHHLELALDFPNDWYHARSHDEAETRSDFERRVSIYFQGNEVGDASSELTVIEFVPSDATRTASQDDLRSLGAPEVNDAGTMRDCRQEIDQRGDPVHRCTSVTERVSRRYAQLETYFLEHGRVVFVRGMVDLPAIGASANGDVSFREIDKRLETVDQIVASIRFAK